MKKTATLDILGPFQLEFEYRISFDGKEFTGSHREIVLGLTKEDLTEERRQKEITKCITKILEKMQNDDPDFIPDAEGTIKIDVNNVKTGFYNANITLDFK